MKQSAQIFPDWFAKCLGFGFLAVGMVVFFHFYIRWINRSDTFRIQNIEVTGNELLSSDELAEEGGVAEDKNIWAIDLTGITKQLKSHVYVEDVRIQRQLPDRIKVAVKEKNPVALLNFKGKLYCLDQAGLVLPSAPNKVYDLPVISGQYEGGVTMGQYVSGSAIGHGLQFINTLLADRAELYSHISEVNIHKTRGLRVYLSQSAIPVSVGYGQYKMKIRSLDAILRELSQESGELNGVRYINLQYKGQVVVGMRT